MADAFFGEIRIMSFGYAPRGWASCDGQLLPIAQNQALFSLLGTIYGGDGQNTFALPNLQGRLPIHMGNGHSLGEQGGATSVTLTDAQMPAHRHQLFGSASPADTESSANTLLAATTGQIYRNPGGGPGPDTVLASSSISASGGDQPHPNMQPFLPLNFCIAIQSMIFPTR